MKPDLLHPRRSKALAPNFSLEPANFNACHTVSLKGYGKIDLRPIRLGDQARLVAFHETLSEESIYLRYFEHISLDTRTLPERLAHVCTNTADSLAIVAARPSTRGLAGDILGVGRLTTTQLPGVASFALLIRDELHDTTLAREMLQRLIVIARDYGFTDLEGELLVADHETLTLCHSLDFHLHTIPEDGIVRVSLPL